MEPDPFAPDLADEWPDRAHERLRQELLEHLQQLADSFLLGQTAADMAATFLAAVVPMQAAVTDLQARVAALESPPVGGRPVPAPARERPRIGTGP